MYPQGNLQGLFAMMLPTADWLVLCDYMRANFAYAPADWLAGRWLFQQNWRIAFMAPVMAVYHCTGANFADSSRLAVARSLSSDPFFADKPLEWDKCNRATAASHPFKVRDTTVCANADIGCNSGKKTRRRIGCGGWGATLCSWSCPGPTSRATTWACRATRPGWPRTRGALCVR
jgi:hypothetical protein